MCSSNVRWSVAVVLLAVIPSISWGQAGRPNSPFKPKAKAAAEGTADAAPTAEKPAEEGKRQPQPGDIVTLKDGTKGFFVDFDKHRQLYDDTSVIPTPAFFYGLKPGEEISVEIEPGKTLIIKYLTTGEPHEDGTRTVFFELNGQPREVNVADRSLEGNLHKNAKAEPDDPNQIAAPMPGKVSQVAVKKGDKIKAGERLLSIEAMKMETAVYCPREATVGSVEVKAGAVVAAGDLLVTLETEEPAPVYRK